METALRGGGLQLRITAQGSFSVEPAPRYAGIATGRHQRAERSLDATTEDLALRRASRVTIGKGAHSQRNRSPSPSRPAKYSMTSNTIRA